MSEQALELFGNLSPYLIPRSNVIKSQSVKCISNYIPDL